MNAKAAQITVQAARANSNIKIEFETRRPNQLFDALMIGTPQLILRGICGWSAFAGQITIGSHREGMAQCLGQKSRTILAFSIADCPICP
jgi:hypothetical protein